LKINIHASGRYYEYRAVDYLKERGFKAIRVPVSAAGKQPLPDIIASNNNVIYAIEVKSTSASVVEVDSDQVEKLFGFCDIFLFCECRPAVLVFFKRIKKVYFVELTQNQRGHNVRISSTKLINQNRST